MVSITVTDDKPKMASNQYIVVEIGPDDATPQSSKTPETAVDTKVMKQPLSRPKSNTRRKLRRSPLERMIGKPSVCEVESGNADPASAALVWRRSPRCILAPCRVSAKYHLAQHQAGET
jgi:hypothetical protein